jgi:hypothetical protein
MLKRRQDRQKEIPGANESPEKDLGSRRGVDYERVELPGELLPVRHEHDGAMVFPTPTKYSGTASDRGVVRFRSRKPKRVFTQGRKLGQRAAHPVYAEILGDMTSLPIDGFIAKATARGKPTPEGQHYKEMLGLFVQVMRGELGYSPAAIQKLTGLSPSQVTRLSAHELPWLRSRWGEIADCVDRPVPTRRIDRDSYTAPQRHEHPAHRTRFGANQSRMTEDALTSTLAALTEKVVALEAKVADLKQQTRVHAANQVAHADRLDLLEGLGRPKAPRDASALLDHLT